MNSITNSVKIKCRKNALLASILAVLSCAPQSLAIAATSPTAAERIVERAKDNAWTKIQVSGSDNLDANKYWLAEPQLKEALALAEASGFNDMRLAKSLGELGRYYKVRGLFSTAEPLFEKEFATKEEVIGTGDGRLIQPLGSLIIFYLNDGTKRKAYPLSLDLLGLIDGKMKDPSNQPHDAKKFKKGMTLDGWAGSAAPAATDPLLEWAIVCDAVGGAYRNANDLEMAEKFYKAALDLKTTILGEKHLSLANSYDNLGMICLGQGDSGEAVSYLKDALDITRRIQPPEHPEVFSRVDKLARAYIQAKKYAEAEQLYVSAQRLWDKNPALGGEPSRCYYALGSLYILEKKYSSAASCLSRALRLAEQTSGPSSFVLVPYLQQYAYALYYLGRRGETNSLRARASYICPRVPVIVPLVASAGRLPENAFHISMADTKSPFRSHTLKQHIGGHVKSHHSARSHR